MKTNHRRNFKETYRMYGGSPIGGTAKYSAFADVVISAGWGGDNSNGHRGIAKAKRGGKKYVRSRIRYHENQKTKSLLKETYENFQVSSRV